MAEDTDQLKAEINQQRAAISGTVQQIENRVSPSRIMARRQDRFRRRLTEMKDSVFGNEEPDYDSYSDRGFRQAGLANKATGSMYLPSEHTDSGSGLASAFGQASDVVDAVHHAPQALRRQTRGNPMAAGLVALAGGWLVGSLLPQSRQERQLARKLEPEITQAAVAVKAEGMELAGELTEPAKEAAVDLTQSGRDAAKSVLDQAASH